MRLVFSILFSIGWLQAQTAMAYFSKAGSLDGLSYRVFAFMDPECRTPLEPSRRAEIDHELDTSPLTESLAYRGCFTAVFDIEVRSSGLFSFSSNGFVNTMALVAQGQYSELPTYYENDSVIAEVFLEPGPYRIYSRGEILGTMPINQWGVGNAIYQVLPAHEYHRAAFLVTAARGICLGILGIMAIFFLFMTPEQDRVFLLYGALVASNILFIESMRSLSAELLGLRNGRHYFASWNLLEQSLGTLMQFTMGIFFAAFYEIKTIRPQYYRYFLFMQGLILLEIPLSLANFPYYYPYSAAVILLGTISLLATMIIFAIRRGGLYYLMLAGYCIMLTCSQYFIATFIGLVEAKSIWGRDLHLIGSTFEVILFSVATSLKLNHQFSLQKKQKDHVVEQLQKMVYPHQLQKIRDGSSLEATMPTGKAEACVLAFDIIGSSRIQHEKIKDFFEQAIERCVSTMYERYDPQLLSADAYRIKVVGDGFLCSIGFPFHTPHQMPTGDAAVRLAMRMVKAFNQVEREFNYHEPIYCAIGLAQGTIEAYFPKSGTKEYDLYGQAIVLATRYEQLRKQLFSPEKSDYIILQEKVFDSLSPELREQFSCVNLQQHRIRVRDDDTAQRVYVWQNSESEAWPVFA